jgi:hypothetical protein
MPMRNLSIYFIAPVFLFVLLAGCSGSSASSEKVLLRLNYKSGEEHIYLTTTETSQSADIAVKDQMEIGFRVIAAEQDGSYEMAVDLLRMRYDMVMGGTHETYDSDKNPEEMTEEERSMHEEFRGALEAELRFSGDAAGKITRPLTHSTGEPAETIIDIRKLQIVFPEQKVGVGDSWEDQMTVELTSATIATTYTIKAITADRIIISASSDIKGPLATNTSTGTYELDKKTCRLLKSTTVMELSTGGSATFAIAEKQ